MKLFWNPIEGLVKTMLACGVLAALGSAPVFGQVYSGTLAGLANGGTLTIDDKTFSGFSYQVSGLTTFDPTAITVTASESGGVDYLTWAGNMSFTSTGIATADVVLNYIVTANPGAINMIDQSYDGTANNGTVAVDETASIGSFGGVVVAYSQLNPSNPSQLQGPNLVVNPAQSVLYVTKDITFAVTSTNVGSVTIDQVVQSFHQVPEPASVLLGSLGGGLLWLLRRQTRRN